MLKRLFVVGFRFFFYLLYRSHLRDILYKVETLDLLANSTLPVLLLANHSNWWDGILMVILAEKLMPHREITIAMLKKEWKKRKWMSHFGVLPIEPNSPGQLLDFFKQLKAQRTMTTNFCFIYFFEGKMTNPGESQTAPQRGTDLVIQQIAPVLVLPTSIVFDIRHRSKPSVYVTVGEPCQISDPQELPPVYAKISALTQSTITETTAAQEYVEKLYDRGWLDLW